MIGRDEDHFISLGWDLRDQYNAVAAWCDRLLADPGPAERLRWADLLQASAERCIRTLDRMEVARPED